MAKTNLPLVQVRLRLHEEHGALYQEMARLTDKTFRGERVRQLAHIGLLVESGRLSGSFAPNSPHPLQPHEVAPVAANLTLPDTRLPGATALTDKHEIPVVLFDAEDLAVFGPIGP